VADAVTPRAIKLAESLTVHGYLCPDATAPCRCDYSSRVAEKAQKIQAVIDEAVGEALLYRISG